MIRIHISWRASGVLALALLAALLTPAASRGPSPQAKPAAGKHPVADPQVIDPAGYQQLLAKQRGKVVLVDFWATWCEPCRDEFPMINELAKQYGSQGLVVMAVSLDDDGEITLVRKFLERFKPVFPIYRKRPGKDDEFINVVDRRWSGAIPADFFYDREGHQAAALVGEHTRADFERAIESLLAGKPR